MWPFSRRRRPSIEEVREDLRSEFQTYIAGVSEQMDIRLRQGTQKTPPAHVQTAVRGFRRQTPTTRGVETARGLTDRVNTDAFKGPVYNLGEVYKALDVESYFARAVQRQRVLCMKQGWRIRGRDPQRVRYIQKRLAEICLVSETTLGQILREVFTNLFTGANHFLVLKRDTLRSSGGKIRMWGRSLDPISGIYSADPTTMEVKQSKSGLIEAWRQKGEWMAGLQGSRNSKTFRHQDVIHIFTDRRTGFVFGTPYVIPVLDDMRLLRRLEELSDIIAHKHAFPLMVVTVGTEDKPADEVMVDGGNMRNEIDIAKEKFEYLDFEGGVVVPERYKVELVGAEGEALDLNPFIKHVEERVLSGLRLSDIDLGRGDSSNRNTAQSITQTLVDSCTEVQKIVEEFISEKIFFMLLQEGDFQVDLSNPDDDMVYLDFPPIDTEEQRAQENHFAGLYEANLVTEDEARLGMGRKPVTEADRERMFMMLVQEPTSQMEMKAQQQVERTKASVKAKTQPSNQHGKKTTKPKVSKNSLEASFLEQVDYHCSLARENFLAGIDLRPGEDPHIGESWHRSGRPRHLSTMDTKAGFQGARLIHHFRSVHAGVLVDARTFLTPLINLGFEETIGTREVEKDYVTKALYESFFQNHVQDTLKNHLRSTGNDILRGWEMGMPDRGLLRSRLEVQANDLRNQARRQARLAYAYGVLLGAGQVGAEAIRIEAESDGSACSRCAPREIFLPTALQDMVCFKPDCRVKYAIAGKARTDEVP